MTMSASVELESFIAKFRYLCSAGYQASLSLKSENGIARVSFDVTLGFVPPPVSLPPPVSPSQQRHRSPAYLRRLKRRKEARQNSARENDVLLMNHRSDANVNQPVRTEEDTDAVEHSDIKLNESISSKVRTEEVAQVMTGSFASTSFNENISAEESFSMSRSNVNKVTDADCQINIEEANIRDSEEKDRAEDVNDEESRCSDNGDEKHERLRPFVGTMYQACVGVRSPERTVNVKEDALSHLCNLTSRLNTLAEPTY